MPNIVRVPSYKLHKPSGQARAIIRGRHVYLGPYGSPESREKYARLIAEVAGLCDPSPSTPGPTTITLVVQLCAAYLEHCQRYYGDRSGSMHRVRIALKLLRHLYASLPVREFGPLKLQAIQQHLIQEGNSRRYVNDITLAVRRVFRWGASQAIVPAVVLHGLGAVHGIRKGRTVAREPEPIGPVDEVVVDATLPHLPMVVADMIRLQRITGMRPGEVCKVRPIDVDRTGDVWIYKVPKHKTEHFGRERVVCIGPKGQDILRPYLLRAADAYCFSPAESEENRLAEMRARRKTRVQPSQVNRRKKHRIKKLSDHYDKDSYRQAVVRGIEKANCKRIIEAADQGAEPDLLPHWSPNQLRHSKATEVRRRFGLEAAQVTLGHAHARITEVYAERDTKRTLHGR
jgi:integrase